MPHWTKSLCHFPRYFYLEVPALGLKPIINETLRVSGKAQHELPLSLQLIDSFYCLMDLKGRRKLITFSKWGNAKLNGRQCGHLLVPPQPGNDTIAQAPTALWPSPLSGDNLLCGSIYLTGETFPFSLHCLLRGKLHGEYLTHSTDRSKNTLVQRNSTEGYLKS